MTFKKIAFDDLRLEELYAILRLRVQVFVVEQDCPYQDLDDRDQASWHLLGLNDDEVLVAYVRLLPPGLSYEKYASIGRVVTHPEHRGTGAGQAVMRTAIAEMQQLYPGVPIKISAQRYLERFYQNLGFKIVGEPYMEDGIPHIGMLLSA